LLLRRPGTYNGIISDGKLKSQYINQGDANKFSDVFWVSQGLDGDMMGASMDNLTKCLPIPRN